MDVILIAWQLDNAPAINTLSYHARKQIRVPVFALCGGHPEDHVSALAAGTDETLSFPLYVPLVQMKAAVYRRNYKLMQPSGDLLDHSVGQSAQTESEQENWKKAGIRLDRRAFRFFVAEQEMPLTMREFKLLEYMLEHAGAARSRNQILDAVWGINFDTGTNMVDVYMYFLRKKLGVFGLKDLLQTVRGLGYRLSLPGSDFYPSDPSPVS